MRIEETNAVIERDELPNVIGDQRLVTQLYQNLIGNALKFMPTDRTPRIHLTAERTNAFWTLGVADNGVGIEPEFFDQIFKPFKRLHAAHEFEGTGIGLTICERAVARMDGRIWCEPVSNEGSHFYFNLPDPSSRSFPSEDKNSRAKVD